MAPCRFGIVKISIGPSLLVAVTVAGQLTICIDTRTQHLLFSKSEVLLDAKSVELHPLRELANGVDSRRRYIGHVGKDEFGLHIELFDIVLPLDDLGSQLARVLQIVRQYNDQVARLSMFDFVVLAIVAKTRTRDLLNQH